MTARRRPISFSRFLTEHEPHIAVGALIRLRWLAVLGQVGATVVAATLLHLSLPLPPIGLLIGFTAVSNAGAVLALRRGQPPSWLVQALLLLDVGSLTGLLYFTGGAANPFSMLFLVHVTMAVTLLGSVWTWVVVAVALGCYGALFAWYQPLVGLSNVAPHLMATGHWLALALVAVLISVFIGRIEHSLRGREDELVDMRERATKNELLATLTTLAAGAAHELNTPLGTIAVVAKELEVSSGSATDAESVREDARLIRREVDRCREIINRLRLDVGEDVAQRKPVAMAQLVKDIRTDLREEENARLRVLVGSDVETATAPRALEQAILVLLRNAFDASPAEAGVTLSIQRREGRIRIEVEDRGTGMSEDLLRRAGQPFYTTKEPGKGMGLGLFLVRLVAERCGAEFSLYSKLGEGTRCVLELGAEVTKNSSGARREAAMARTQ